MEEIKSNTNNIAEPDSLANQDVLSDVREKLLHEKQYFLSQQNYHLEAVVKEAISQDLNEVDTDELLKKVQQLKNNMDKLSIEA